MAPSCSFFSDTLSLVCTLTSCASLLRTSPCKKHPCKKAPVLHRKHHADDRIFIKSFIQIQPWVHAGYCKLLIDILRQAILWMFMFFLPIPTGTGSRRRENSNDLFIGLQIGTTAFVTATVVIVVFLFYRRLRSK